MSVSQKYTRRKSKSSAITIIISICLVLFLIGVMGILFLNTKKLSEYIKENIGFSVIINDNAKEAEVRKLQKILDATSYVKSTRYISKKQAAAEFKKELGDDFVEAIGYNPLLATIEVNLYASYANSDSISEIEKDLSGFSEIKEIYYQKNLVHLVNENVKKISFVLLIVSTLLFLISFTLINNTIRLSIFSQRFLINTMQLVGATNGFIRKPYVNRGIIYGFIAALLAILLLAGVVFFIQMKLSSIIVLNDIKILGIVFAGLIILGILFAWLSTHIAVNTYLRKQTNDLY